MNDAAALLVPLGVGLIAGAINTVAGGGSLLTIPLLVEMGLTPMQANATNRVGVAAQATTSSITFWRNGHVSPTFVKWLVGPALAGAALGAWLAATLDESLFRRTCAILFFAIGAYLLHSIMAPSSKKPDVAQDQASADDAIDDYVVASGVSPAGDLTPSVNQERPPLWMLPAFFGVGVYGGFIQAGVGIVAVVVMHVIGGHDLVRSNATKVVVVLCFTALALLIFASQGLVVWQTGAGLAVGGAIGGWAGAKLAPHVNARVLKSVLVVAVFVAAVRFWTG